MMRLCEDVMLRPFVWGKVDCVTCAADVFVRAYRIDPIKQIRGKWKTRREADRLLAEIGGWNYGFPDMFAAAGLVEGDRVGAICISAGKSIGLAIKAADGIFLGKSLTGMAVLPRSAIWRSWCLK